MPTGVLIGVIVATYITRRFMKERVSILEKKVERLRREKAECLDTVEKLKAENARLRSKMS